MFEINGHYINGITYKQKRLENYLIDYIPGKRNILILTFENADIPAGGRADPGRMPWGLAPLLKSDVSVLGVKPFVADWYRSSDIRNFFKSSDFSSFVSSFQRVIFYGSSMGGFAALTFVEACPGADVLALNPQSSLDPRKVPWERRYKAGQEQDWSGAFSDGAESISFARKAYIAYDPLFEPDRAQVERMPLDNVVTIKAPLLKHSIPVWFLQMGVLKTILAGVVDDTLSQAECHKLMRQRRSIARYYTGMADRSRSDYVKQWCVLKAQSFGPPNSNLLKDILDIQITRLDISGALDSIVRLTNSGEHPARKLEQLYENLIRSKQFLQVIMISKNNRVNIVTIKTRILVAESLLNLGRLNEASEAISLLLSQEAASGQMHRLASRISIALGNSSEALRHAQIAVELDPLSIFGLHLLSSIQLSLDLKSDTLSTLTKLLELDPGHAGALEKMGQISSVRVTQ